MKANCSRVLTEVGEMNNFVSEKRRLVREDSYRDGIGILRQSKEAVNEWRDAMDLVPLVSLCTVGWNEEEHQRYCRSIIQGLCKALLPSCSECHAIQQVEHWCACRHGPTSEG